MAYTEQQMIAVVTALGGTVEVRKYEDKSGDYLIDAPKGSVWSATHTHALREDFANSAGFSWKPKTVASLMTDVLCGIQKCDETDCDMCGEVEL